MWLENRQEPYPGKCSKDTLKINVTCCNVIVQFVLCTKVPAMGMVGGEIQIHMSALFWIFQEGVPICN